MINLKVVKNNNNSNTMIITRNDGRLYIEEEQGTAFIMFRPNQVKKEKSVQSIIDELEDDRRRHEDY